MKKKIFLIALAACLITLSVAGSSLAYFTDTDTKANVFTSGNVDIQLNMEVYDPNNSETKTKMYPGMDYDNYATIKNIGSEKAYVGAIIEVVLPSGLPNTLTVADVAGIFKNLDLATTKYTATTNGYKFYVVIGELDTTATATVFEKVSIPAAWDHKEMAIFKDMTVNVTGYAVQTVGLGSAETALTAAFTTDWAAYNTNAQVVAPAQAEQVDPST